VRVKNGEGGIVQKTASLFEARFEGRNEGNLNKSAEKEEGRLTVPIGGDY